MFMCVCVCVCVCAFMCVCVYVYVCVCARALVRVRDGTCFYVITQCVFAVFVLCASCASFCFHNKGVMLLTLYLYLDKATIISLVPDVNEILS